MRRNQVNMFPQNRKRYWMYVIASLFAINDVIFPVAILRNHMLVMGSENVRRPDNIISSSFPQ